MNIRVEPNGSLAPDALSKFLGALAKMIVAVPCDLVRMRVVAPNVFEWRWDPKGATPAREQILSYAQADNPTITFPQGAMLMGELRAVQPVRDALADLMQVHKLTLVQVQW